MDDLISRQDVIDAFWKIDVEMRPTAIDAVINMLENMPSAEPEEYTIEMQEADIDEAIKHLRNAKVTVLPSAEPKIIYCKDCRKHNHYYGHYCDGTYVSIRDCCPLIEVRGMAQGHEFDYQFCAWGERRQDE